MIIPLIIILILIMLSITGSSEKDFISTKKLKLKSDRMKIVLLDKKNKKGIKDVNSLLKMSDGWVYSQKIVPKKLSWEKVFVGYLDGEAVATTTIKEIKWGYDKPHLTTGSSVVHKDHRRKGLMTELKRTIFDYLKENNIDKVVTQVHVENEINQRAVEKMGFAKTHEYEKHIFYEMML